VTRHARVFFLGFCVGLATAVVAALVLTSTIQLHFQ